jgi:SAM-dependent methyltransferase
MRIRNAWLSVLLAIAIGPSAVGAAGAQPSVLAGRTPDVNFVPTPQPVVDAMLDVAKVGRHDVLYDLGSGDGRIPITAARRFGTRGVGFDIDPQRVAEADAHAQQAGVADKVRFVHGDIFRLDVDELGKATVIALYLLPELNLQLRPTLLKLAPGTRIVSHAFDMGDWAPDRTLNVGGRLVHFWTVPAR